jgi:hypothetical protein
VESTRGRVGFSAPSLRLGDSAFSVTPKPTNRRVAETQRATRRRRQRKLLTCESDIGHNADSFSSMNEGDRNKMMLSRHNAKTSTGRADHPKVAWRPGANVSFGYIACPTTPSLHLNMQPNGESLIGFSKSAERQFSDYRRR